MKVTRRQFPVIEQPQRLFHFAFAALPNPYNRISRDKPKRFPPDLEPVKRAALISIDK